MLSIRLFKKNIDKTFSMSCFSQKLYWYSLNFKPCKLVKTQFQSIVFLSTPNSAAKNTWSLYLIELLIRGQIDQLGFAFFLFSAFLTCTRVNVDCMFPDEGGLNCVSTMTQVSKFCQRIMKFILAWSTKVQLFWEGHKHLRNLPHGFDVYLLREEDYTNFCDLLRKA